MQRLQVAGAVLIEGPRACGKTITARQAAASEVLLDIDQNARQAAAVDPNLLLAGDAPRLLDEWQVEPTLWNHVRRTVDQRQTLGQFILTGSAMPADDLTRHTGAGRISRLKLRTMTLLEMGLSSGEASLRQLLQSRFRGCANADWPLPELTMQLSRGGWPGELRLGDRACLTARADYLEEICRVDVSRTDGARRNPDNVRRVLRSLARNVATTASARTIALDTSGADSTVDDDSVRTYLNALRRLMICEDQPAWAPHLRSRSELRNSPKRHFADPSLAVAALGATPARLLADLNLLGLLFESLVHHELAVYAQACDAHVRHYRDNTGLEVDAVVETRQGDWCAFEVKLGTGQVDAAAKTLLKFRDRVDAEKSGTPRALGVIVSSGYGYVREDGVAVVPIRALGP